VRWLVISVTLSVMLTVLLNVGLRAFPATGRRFARSLATAMSPSADAARVKNRRIRVFLPWKAMILGSLILTIAVNVILRIA